MSDQRITTKAELLADSERDWSALTIALERLTDEQKTTLRDAAGWSVKDHVSHLTDWERSMVFMLQGQPRHLGLGVDETLYLNSEDEAINAVLYQQHKDLPLAEVVAQFRDTHQQLLALLKPLTDADLQQPYRHYLPTEPGDGDGPPVINLLYGNSAHHFREHLEWIEALVSETKYIYNYRQINDQCITGGQPSTAQLQAAAREGFTTIINLATINPRYSLENEAGLAQSLGLAYHHIPVIWDAPTAADFAAFESVMDSLPTTDKTLIHCAANFRVTAFYSLYALKKLGWTEAQADEFRASVWAGSNYPIWEQYIREMKAKLAG